MDSQATTGGEDQAQLGPISSDSTQAPAPLPTVPELVTDVLTEMPSLAPVVEQVDMLMVLYTTYVGGPDFPVQPMTLENALDEIDLAKHWDLQSIETMATTITAALADQILVARATFEAKTGDESGDSDEFSFDQFEDRYNLECEEQDALIALANKVLTAVRNVSGQLGIRNPDPVLLEPVGGPIEKVEPKPRRWAAIKQRMRTVRRSYFALPSEVSEAEVAEPTTKKAPPSWATPPILVESDRELRTLASVERRLEGQIDISQVKSALSRIDLGTENLTRILLSVAKKARAQLAQSKQVKVTAAGDYSEVATILDSAQGLQNTVDAVYYHFFPETQAG